MSMLTIVLFVVGIGLLIFGADVMVRGAASLALAVGVSPLVVGLTVVAFGTSAPELAVSVQSALNGVPGIALGNVVGSNIANVLLILGLAGIVAPLAVDRQILRFDLPLMIVVSLIMFVMSLDGAINWIDGLLLVAGIIAYTAWLVITSRREHAYANPDDMPASQYPWYLNLALVIGGLGLLVVGARWIVDGAVAFAQLLGIPELIIGLTIVAVGTSLPEIAVSVLAAMRGQREIVVGNVIGSNIFNILSVLGFTALLAPIPIAVPFDALTFDIPVMILVAFFAVPIFLTRREISRWEAVIFLLLFGMYTTALVLEGMQHSFLPTYLNISTGIVAILGVLLVGLMLRDLRQSRTRSAPRSQIP